MATHRISIEYPNPDTDYKLLASIQKAGMWHGLRVSNLLESASIRHCLFGDVVAQALGSDVLIGHTILIVEDAQVDAAGALVTSTGGFYDAPLTEYCNSTGDNFPGFSFAMNGIDAKTRASRMLLVPASYLHFDLNADHWEKNTVLLTEPRCRLPNKSHYINALVNTIAERTLLPESNGGITLYLNRQLFEMLRLVPKSLAGRLPPENQLLIELIDKVMLPSARIKLCKEWYKIRRGETTVEKARRRVPRKDLEIAKLKAKYQAMKNDEDKENRDLPTRRS